MEHFPIKMNREKHKNYEGIDNRNTKVLLLGQPGYSCEILMKAPIYLASDTN